MHIFSKLQEQDILVSDQNISDEYLRDTELGVQAIDAVTEAGGHVHIEKIFCSGLYIQEVHYQLVEPTTENFMTEGDHVRLFFYLDGHSQVLNGAGNTNYCHKVGMLMHNYLNANGGGGLIKIPKLDIVHYILIKMSKQFYLQLLADEPWIADDAFHKYILSGPPRNQPNECWYMNQRLVQILTELLHAGTIQRNAYHFIRIKLKELLFNIHQLRNFQTHCGCQNLRLIKTLEGIRAHLALHLENLPTISELAMSFGLTEKKLKQEFKKQYQMTIHAFVLQLRMEKAAHLLNVGHNVNEIAIILGYQSVSHFIKVFKTHYAHTPKEYVLRLRGNS